MKIKFRNRYVLGSVSRIPFGGGSPDTLQAPSSKLQANRGFTLIEMIVAVGLFMLVMVIAVGSLVSIVAADRKAESIESVVDNLRFAIDDISRETRTGTEYYCGGYSAGGTQDCTNGSDKITFTDQDGNRVSFKVESSNLCGTNYAGDCLARCENSADGTITECPGSYSPITSPSVDIEKAEFYVAGSTPGPFDTQQPRIVMTLSAEITSGVSSPTVLNLQTTVTQRVYDE
ncbi:MAG: PilW family protein [Minisyncoccia bacterium]